MIVCGLILYLSLSLFWPDALVTQYCDIPLLAVLLSQKRISLARWGAFLSMLNSSCEIHAFIGISVLIRLLSVDLTHHLLKNVYASLFVRASLSTGLLVLLDWMLSCFLLPALFPSLFFEVPGWHTKLFLFSSALLLGLTCSLFLIMHIVNRVRRNKRHE